MTKSPQVLIFDPTLGYKLGRCSWLCRGHWEVDVEAKTNIWKVARTYDCAVSSILTAHNKALLQLTFDWKVMPYPRIVGHSRYSMV